MAFAKKNVHFVKEVKVLSSFESENEAVVIYDFVFVPPIGPQKTAAHFIFEGEKIRSIVLRSTPSGENDECSRYMTCFRIYTGGDAGMSDEKRRRSADAWAGWLGWLGRALARVSQSRGTMSRPSLHLDTNGPEVSGHV